MNNIRAIVVKLILSTTIPGFGLVSLSCQPKRVDDSKVTSINLKEVINFETDDSEMNAAIELARNTLETFKNAFDSNDPAYSTFALKVAFPDAIGGHEHIWMVDLTKEGDMYYGTVGNEPVNTTEVVMGQRMEIDEGRISDWMFLDNNVLKGGYTLIVIRNRMSAEERQQFDYSVGFTFPE